MPKRRKKKAPHARRQKALFITSFLLTLLICGGAAAVTLADSNSRRVGWDESRTVFAVSTKKQTYHLTLLGRHVSVSFPYTQQVKDAAACFWRGYTVVEPSGERLWEQLHTVTVQLAREELRRLRLFGSD